MSVNGRPLFGVNTTTCRDARVWGRPRVPHIHPLHEITSVNAPVHLSGLILGGQGHTLLLGSIDQTSRVIHSVVHSSNVYYADRVHLLACDKLYPQRHPQQVW